MTGEPMGGDDASSNADETGDPSAEDLAPTAEAAEEVKGGIQKRKLFPSGSPLKRRIEFE
jgi:hypothetical protein